MKFLVPALFAAVFAALLAGPCAAQPAAPSDAPNTLRDPAEPDVKRTRIEDEATRIDELRVRGQTQKVVVTPKHGGKPYEIIMGNAGRDTVDGTGGARSAVGKRVWTVLDF